MMREERKNVRGGKYLDIRRIYNDGRGYSQSLTGEL